MGTRALVGIELPDGTVKAAYNHYDGYPSGLGHTLVEHYSNYDKMLEAVMLGDASYWAAEHTPADGVRHDFMHRAEGVSVYYGRDRGETGTAPRTYLNINEALEAVGDAGEEFGYVLTQDGLWVMRERYAKKIVWDAEYNIRKSVEIVEELLAK